jgi:hypothetical protein
MLEEAYLAFPDPGDSDAFFARASSALFETLVEAGPSPDGIDRAIEDRRLMLYSDRPEEQELLATTPLAGTFLAHGDTLGVFLNDGSGSKIGNYVDVEVTVTDRLCTGSGLQSQTLEVTVTHGFDGDLATLPAYVSGGGNFVPVGEFHANVLVYPAVGTGVTSLAQDGEKGFLAPHLHDGRAMSQARIDLAPGESTTLTYELAATGVPTPALVVTPGPREGSTEHREAPAEGC